MQLLEANERLNRELLWSIPYDGLRFWTRWWLDAQRELMRLRRYTQSQVLQIMSKEVREEIEKLRNLALNRKDKAEQQIIRIVRELPEWTEWGKGVVGLGEFSLGKLLGLIGNPAAREYVSCLWRHCGLAPTKDGKLEKPTKGQHRPYNALAKSQLVSIPLWCDCDSV